MWSFFYVYGVYLSRRRSSRTDSGSGPQEKDGLNIQAVFFYFYNSSVLPGTLHLTNIKSFIIVFDFRQKVAYKSEV